MDDRGVTPVVEKLLTIGIVVLFIGSTMAVLYGSAVPSYRDAVGSELGERVLVSAADQIESSIPPNGTAAAGQASVEVPRTIRGERYELRVDGRSLILDHPSQAIAGRIRLSMPGHVESISGTIRSQETTVLGVEQAEGGITLHLEGAA